MNNKIVKKVLAVAMAASMVVMPLTVGATDSSSSSSDSTTVTAAEAAGVTTTSTVNAGGTVLKSSTAGAYSVKTLSGVAVKSTVSEIKAAAGMAANETPFVKAYDITAKKSPAAYASINSAAESMGATVTGAVNIDLGKVTGGKYTELPAGVSVPTTIGIPGGKVDPTKTYAVVKVLPGGATEILQDQDTNPNTVTFNITGGLAAYAVIAY